jgi:hypothetical protein
MKGRKCETSKTQVEGGVTAYGLAAADEPGNVTTDRHPIAPFNLN